MWNPWTGEGGGDGRSRRRQLAPDLVCVETGNVADNRVDLAAGAEHRMTTRIAVDGSRPLPQGAAIVVLGPSAAALGAAGARPAAWRAAAWAARARRANGTRATTALVPHLRALFAAGTPIVGLCASGILVRALAPLLDDKRAEPPVVALAEDGSVAVPLLGGHHGANDIARALAAALGGVAAITTAGDLRLGLALDEPPPGWKIADPERVKPHRRGTDRRQAGGAA